MTSVVNTGLSYLSKKETRKKAVYTYKHHWCGGAPNTGRGEVETRGIEAPKWHLGDWRPKVLRGASRAHTEGSALGGSGGRESNPTA